MKSDQAVLTIGRWSWADRLADYLALSKPRIALMVLATVAVGAYSAAGGSPDGLLVFHTLLGTALVAAGASVLNQWWERDIDAKMPRTWHRPLPAGRVTAAEALALGVLLSLAGLGYLLTAVNLPSAVVALVTLTLYVLVYTPLKRLTLLNTLVGAVPGALPPLIGWAAVANGLEPQAWALFLIIYFWQFPHFWAIAWLYREDYRAGGLRMLPTTALGRRLTGLLVFSYLVLLIPISLAPSVLGTAGAGYFVGALALGVGFLAFGAAFLLRPSDVLARRLLFASLVYLPGVLALLWIDLGGGG
jgi:protoheme IX farnesyltransferase